MIEYFNSYFLAKNVPEETATLLAQLAAVLIVVMIGVGANFLTKAIVVRVIEGQIRRHQFKWGAILLEHQVFQRLSHLAPAFILFFFAYALPEHLSWLQKIAVAYFIFVGVFFLFAVFNGLEGIYNTYEVAKTRPLRGFVQVGKLVSALAGGLLTIAYLFNINFWMIFSGIGAMTAVLLLIFKDPLLGLVAGIQLAANDMVRIGDWIEMPEHNADGEVSEISLTTVKVLNWDNTLTMVPAYSLISGSFKNWRQMQESGGRRIKRALYLDTSSVTFCTPAMLEDFKQIRFLREYLVIKEQELAEYSRQYPEEIVDAANGRHLTNVGTFRAYVQFYLRQHPAIHPEMIRMVRQLPPGEHGIPLEIYAFVNDTAWEAYEAVQADIFDHLLAVAPRFALRIFQSPTGHDWRQGLW